jgi:integrase/recombinase XerD
MRWRISVAKEIVMSTLREQMAVDLQLRGITPRTQKKYLREVSNLAKYYNKSPQDLGEQEVKDYLVHLLKDRGLSVGTYRNYAAGIKFLYTTTLNRPEVVDKIKYPKSTHKPPGVFDLSEIKSLFSVMDNIKHRALLTITYSAGLRVSEVACLRVTDIDSKRMMVRVQQGKGGKDRYSILCKTALECLREYYRSALYRVFNVLNRILIRWAMRKHTRFRFHQRRATQWLRRIACHQPWLFAHWEKGFRP